MILEAGQRDALPDVVAMVDGCFDPLHRGHIEYFQLSRSLGVPVLCNAASDEYILSRKRRPPLLPERDRVVVLDSIRYIDFTFVSPHGTAWSLRHFRPRYYVKGADWRGTLPPEQVAICAEQGTEVVYVDCPRDSSTRILQAFVEGAQARLAI